MYSKRVFKTKTFDRWVKKLIPDHLLCAAAQEIIQGNFDADLGGGVCKKESPYQVKVRAVQPEHWWQKSTN